MRFTCVHYSVIAVLVLLFGAVTVMKQGPSWGASEREDDRVMEEDEQRKAVRRFWNAYRTATKHRTAGNYERAARAYEEALDVDSTHEDALYYLGHVNMEQQRFESAEDAWQRLMAVNPRSARGYVQLGELRFCFPEADLFDLEEAQANYERALALHNEETRPLVRLATIALVQNRTAAAQPHVEAILGSNEEEAIGYLLGGYLAWKRGDVGHASVMTARAAAVARREAESDRALIGTCPLADALLSLETGPDGPRRTEWVEQRFQRLERQMRRVRSRQSEQPVSG